ncbi:MAG: hypothetical protein CL754_05810, partial [Chloroflexi bacterium]|nr:hypothetical protein [Chloroflexota bacterium]
MFGLLVGGAMIATVACGGADDVAAEPIIIRETVIVTEKGEDVIVERTVVVTEKGDTETVEVVVTATAAPVNTNLPAP